MTEETSQSPEFLVPMTHELEERIKHIPFLDIDTYVIPSPYIRHNRLEKDYSHSYAWDAQGEILGHTLVYSDPRGEVFHLYKQVTSPFGRGQGIGSAFIEKLVSDLPDHSLIYLYVWEKQIDSIDFFKRRGFKIGERTVYKHQTFCLMEATAGDIRQHLKLGTVKKRTEKEKIGKVRHDARKNLQLLLDMVNMLSVENCSQLIESINRECTSLVNMLNDYGDKLQPEHRINVRDVIMERVIPYIEASATPCQINLCLLNRVPTVTANYVEVGRALLNLAANSLDAIEDCNHPGIIDIELKTDDEHVILVFRDNGGGIEPERLALDNEGIPLFVGNTTKGIEAGEGFGTKQVYSTFRADHIQVKSEPGKYTEWVISLEKSTAEKSTILSELETRYLHLVEGDSPTINDDSTPDEIIDFIWHARDIELLSYDLVFQFSRHNNIRDIYRSIMVFRYGGQDEGFIKKELDSYRTDEVGLREHLMEVLRRIMHNDLLLNKYAVGPDYEGELFKSYGRSDNFTMIFTLDPENGRYFCTDRKLAEHLDLAAYLGKDREDLLRGELNGDARNIDDPVILGVWSTKTREDLFNKLRLIQAGCKKMIEMGFDEKKHLGFYNTTYNLYEEEIDSYKKTTLGDMAAASETALHEFIVGADNELAGFVFAD